MKILNHTKLLLASSLLALTLGSQACPDDQQISQASFRALKVTLGVNGEKVDDLLVASMATGGGLGNTALSFERLRGAIAGNTQTVGGLQIANTGTLPGGSTGTLLSPNPAVSTTVPTPITAQRAAIIGARNVIELITALNAHVTGNVLNA